MVGGKLRIIVDHGAKFLTGRGRHAGDDLALFFAKAPQFALALRIQAVGEGGAGDEFQVTQGDEADAVLLVDHLALLGHAQVAPDGPRRRAENAVHEVAAAAADGAAAAMEKAHLHVLLPAALDQVALRFVQGPARGHDAAVLAAVGVTQHDHLALPERLEVAAIDGQVKQPVENGGSGVQIVDRFEQRSHGQAGRGFGSAVGNGIERHDRQHVVGVPRHADDEHPDRLDAVVALGPVHRPEHV